MISLLESNLQYLPYGLPSTKNPASQNCSSYSALMTRQYPSFSPFLNSPSVMSISSRFSGLNLTNLFPESTMLSSERYLRMDLFSYLTILAYPVSIGLISSRNTILSGLSRSLLLTLEATALTKVLSFGRAVFLVV